jgi:hypothetical protein
VLVYKPPPFNTSVYAGINLTLALLGLTNITLALEEFNNVRVLNQLLSGSPSNQISPSSNEKLSAGLEVLIGLACFRASCFILFGLEWLTARQQWRKQGIADVNGGKKSEGERAYQLMRRLSRSSEEEGPPASTLKTLAFDSYAMRKEKVSEYTLDSNRTRVELGSDLVREFAEWKFHCDHDHSPSFGDP